MRRVLLLAAAAAVGFSPFRAEEPHVREGNERVTSGQPEAALPRYDAAEKAAGPRPEIDYDRGIALYRLGKSTEARDAFRKALERSPGDLASRAHQNLGNALSAAGDRDGAIAAYRDALHADPKNEDARFNLEVLLRRKREEDEKKRQEQEQQPSPQRPDQAKGGKPPQGKQSPGEQQQPGAQQPQPAAQQPPQRPGAQPPQAAGAQPQPRSPGAQQPQQPPGARPPSPPPRPQDGQTGGADPRTAEPRQGDTSGPREADAGALSREDAARILDAFRAREKAMPLGPTDRRETRRADADRDW